LYRRIDIVE